VCDTLRPPGEEETLAEPLVAVVKTLAIPPIRLWFRWRFEGLHRIPRRGPAIVACNHISYLDPIAIAYAVVRAGRNPRFLAKDELFRTPVLGTVLRGVGQIPVRRGSRDRNALSMAERALAGGEVVVIYPEGTVTTRPDHLPMEGKTGVARLALAANLPVIPMASWGSAAVWQKTGKGSLKMGRPIWVRVGEPIDIATSGATPDDLDAVRAQTARVMEALTELVGDLRDRYPRRWADAE
jgi:1-acyl-sn-glycerol-3-phosphate acyltransferase